MNKLFFSLLLGISLTVVGCGKHIMTVPESAETLNNWQIAREYQKQERYELARQYYVLALAGAREIESQKALQVELKAVERMIEAMR